MPWLRTSQGEQAEPRLEQQHDPEREEDEAEDERDGADDDRAADEGRCVHPRSLRAGFARSTGLCSPSGDGATRTIRATPSGSHQL